MRDSLGIESMSHRSVLRRAAWILGAVFLIAIVLFVVAAETGGDVATLVLIGGLAVGAVLAAPVLTLAVFALLFIPTFLLLRRRYRRRGMVGTVVGVFAAAAAISISIPIHGESFLASTFYEVPVEISLEPSDQPRVSHAWSLHRVPERP